MSRRLARLLPALWAGALLAIALIGTPAPFAFLAPAQAGRIAVRMLEQEAWLSLALALALFLVERRRAQAAARAGRGSILSPEMLLLLGVIFCTVAGFFGVRPLIDAARAGGGLFGFALLHLASVLLYTAKTVLVLALAWRGAVRA